MSFKCDQCKTEASRGYIIDNAFRPAPGLPYVERPVKLCGFECLELWAREAKAAAPKVVTFAGSSPDPGTYRHESVAGLAVER